MHCRRQLRCTTDDLVLHKKTEHHQQRRRAIYRTKDTPPLTALLVKQGSREHSISLFGCPGVGRGTLIQKFQEGFPDGTFQRVRRHDHSPCPWPSEQGRNDQKPPDSFCSNLQGDQPIFPSVESGGARGLLGLTVIALLVHRNPRLESHDSSIRFGLESEDSFFLNS
jgi:hypothetical protein